MIPSFGEDIPVIDVPVCPMCKSGTGPLYHSATYDRWFGVAGRWSFRQCGNCDGLWLAPRPSTAALPLVYANYYTHAAANLNSSGRSAQRRIRSYLPWHASDRRGEVAYLDGFPPGRVLDVGCGNGERLRRLSERGWVVVGLEVDQRAAEAARAAGHAHVQVGTVHDMEERGTFDAIVMFHVLEHVDDPLDTLRQTRQLLRPGGAVAIATPNCHSWLHRIYGPRWRGLEAPRHLQLFSTSALRGLLSEAGFCDLNLFTTQRNAGTLAFASERSYSTQVTELKRRALLLKSELLQALEWIRLKWSPDCGEELVAIAFNER